MTLPEIDHVSFFAEHALCSFRPWSHYQGDMVCACVRYRSYRLVVTWDHLNFCFALSITFRWARWNGNVVRENVREPLKLASKLSSHRPSLALDGGSINSEANGHSPLSVFSLRSVASFLVEATACRLVNSLIFLNKIQEIKDVRQSKFSAFIF